MEPIVKLILIFVVLPLIWMLLVAWFTGSKDWVYRTGDDERQQWIKQKSVVQSWSTLLLFFISNFLFDVFNLRDERLKDIPFMYPELFYLLLAVVSYFVFYTINHRKMSA